MRGTGTDIVAFRWYFLAFLPQPPAGWCVSFSGSAADGGGGAVLAVGRYSAPLAAMALLARLAGRVQKDQILKGLRMVGRVRNGWAAERQLISKGHKCFGGGAGGDGLGVSPEIPMCTQVFVVSTDRLISLSSRTTQSTLAASVWARDGGGGGGAD